MTLIPKKKSRLRTQSGFFFDNLSGLSANCWLYSFFIFTSTVSCYLVVAKHGALRSNCNFSSISFTSFILNDISFSVTLTFHTIYFI